MSGPAPSPFILAQIRIFPPGHRHHTPISPWPKYSLRKATA